MKKISLNEIMNMQAIEGYGGHVTSSDTLREPHLWKGVLLKEICDAVGGVSKGDVVIITAKDGYSMAFTYDQVVNGEFTTYNPVTLATTSHGPLKLILAYSRDGEPIPKEHGGPLKVAIVGTGGEKPITEGAYWVKWVVKVEIKPIQSWSISLIGHLKMDLTSADFERALCYHGVVYKDSKGNEWKGVPLWVLIGLVDDDVQHGKDAFNETLAKKGYVVRITASDGYQVELNSSQIAKNDKIVVAAYLNGDPLPDKYAPLRLVGDISKKLWISKIVKIEIVWGKS